MNARFSTNGRVPKLQIPLVLLVLVFLSVQHVAHAAMPIDNHPRKGEIALLTPSAYPYALPAHVGKQTVRISVPAQLTGNSKAPVTIFLRRSGTKQSLAMNDLGKMGDFISGDGIHGVYVQIDTDKVKPDSCLYYEAFIKRGSSQLVSPPAQLCVSSFPVGIAKSNTEKPVVLHGGERAVADEVVLHATPKISAATIRELASSINARVVGSILPLNLYQLKLTSPASAEQLLEIVAQLRARTSSVEISVNLLGQGAMHINDTDFNSQHGLRLVVEQDQHGIDSNAWDAGGTGNGVTVVVLDTGLESSHPDLDATWTCQNVPLATAANSIGGILTPPVPVLLAPCADTTVGSTPAGHGTEVTGVIAARTNNSVGVAGVAFGSKIHAIKLRDFSLIGMINGFITAAQYVAMDGNAKVINASFVIEATPGSALGADIPNLCTAINTAVSSGFGAVVVNAVGNNSNKNAINLYSENFYPARCNDASNIAHQGLLNKSRLITVSNSTSGGSCGSVDQLQSTSNYGAWVDIAAPGCDIHTTTRVGTGTAGTDYINVTGNSFSAPLVAGAAAILTSCGVPLNQIEATLKGPPEGSPGANVYVPYPLSTSATKTPRLDIYHALQAFAPTASNLSAAENYTEDTPLNLADIVASSDLSACATIIATLTLPAGVTNIDANTLSTATSGTVTSTFTVATRTWRASGPMANVNVLLSGVTFNPPLNFNGNFNITTSVSDGISTISGSKAMTGIAVNDPPVAMNDSLASVAEDSGIRTIPFAVLTANDDDGDPEVVQTLTITAVSNAVGGTVAINGTNVEFTPTLNFNGAASFDYIVQDNGQTNGVNDFKNSTGSLSFTVTAVNDPPSFMKGMDQAVLEDAGAQTVPNWATSISAGPVDEASQTLTFNLTANTNPSLFSVAPAISPTGTLTYTPAANANGSATITVVLMDNGGGMNTSASQTFSITVTPVNDAPTILGQPIVFSHIEYNQINPGASPPFDDFVGVVGASDPDGDTLSYSITAGNSAVVNGVTQANAFQFDAANPGRLLVANRLALNFEFSPVFNLTVQVTDAGGLFATASVTVTLLNDANDNGDPHITTVDGLHYDFQSAGEFVALRGRSGLEIQTRHTPVSTASAITDPYSGLTAAVSINTAVAARVGKHRVTLQVSSAAAPADMVIRVDGVITTLPQNGLALGIAGRLQPLPNGAIQLDFPDQTTLIVTRGWWAPHAVWYLNLTVLHTPAYEGLMGARASGSWLPRLSDGTSLGAIPANLQDRYKDLYGRFADSWRVSDKTSLFDYTPDTSTQTYTLAGWPKIKPPYLARGPVAKPVKPDVAQKACRAIKHKLIRSDCVFDVMVTGNAGFARTYLIQQGILAGLTRTRLQTIKSGNGDKETLTYIATVEHDANAMAGDGDAAVIPSGTIQFMVDEKPVAHPVKLDGKGQASLALAKSMVSDLHVMARYLPSKGSRFLTSNSPDETLKLSKQRGR